MNYCLSHLQMIYDLFKANVIKNVYHPCPETINIPALIDNVVVFY
jgi:hypothetical protein